MTSIIVRFRLHLFLSVTCTLFAAPVLGDDWPAWRGAHQNGLTSETALPLTWSDSENIHWKIDLSGVGHSSPIVWGDSIFVTSANPDQLTRHLLRIDRETGKTLWDCVIATAPIEPMHRDNTPASTTPVTDGEHVFVSFCDNERLLVAAVDFNGYVAWKVYPGSFAASHGYSTALVLDGQKLFLSGLQDGEDSFIAALDKATGASDWKVKRASDNQLYAIQMETPEQATGKSRIAWKATKGIPYMNSPLCDKGLLHVMSDDGVYRCYRTRDGQVLQEKRVGESIKASMVANSERIYITAVNGKTTVIANHAEFEILAENQLDGSIVASPAISNGDIVIRTETHLVLIRERSSAE